MLIDHDVEGIVTRAAKEHIDNLPVITEASALLYALGMDPVRMNNTSTSGLMPPPPPPLPAVDSIMQSMVGAVVTIDTVTKAS